MRLWTVLAALLLTVPCTGLVLDAPSYATGSVCGSLPRCHVVARADVDGDGRRDVVAVARRGADGATDGSATVLVRTSRSHVASVTRGTFQWAGPLWLGAAHLDGRDGRELVLGASAGVHTRYFRVLTGGGARRRRALLGGAPTWIVDSGNAGVMGWQRTAADPVGLVRRRVAQGDPATGRLTGRVTTYLWGSEGWSRVGSRVVDPVSPRLAGSWAFWHVPGLDVY